MLERRGRARRGVVVDGGGTIDGGGERWWAMRQAQRSGDATATAFLTKDRCTALPDLLLFMIILLFAISKSSV